MDFGRALQDIAADAERVVRSVEIGAVTARVRRRRAQGVVLRSVGGLAVVGGLVAGAGLVAEHATPPPPAAVQVTEIPTPTPTPSPDPAPTTAVDGWVVGAAPCGTTDVPTPQDSPYLSLRGGLIIGDLDPATAMLDADPAGADLLDLVEAGPETPGTPAGADGDGASHLMTVLVDESGTIAFWSDPARQLPQLRATDGSGVLSTYGYYPAVDCRTGRPLAGTYRAFASDPSAAETIELAPLTFGPDGTRPLSWNRGTLPTCGEPAPAALLAGGAGADFTVTLDPGFAPDEARSAGIHVPVTVTANGPGRLRGQVPQELSAVLVDDAGVVVSENQMMGDFPSAATFDVGAGESFGTSLFSWFDMCDHLDPNTGWAARGSYDLYVYDTFPAASGSTTLTAVGGPYRITVR